MASDHKLPADRAQDLRSHMRFPIDAAVVRLTKNGLLASIRANKSQGAVNLSEGGILIRTRERIAEGTKVRITLDLEQFDDHLVTVGDVRWCGQSARGKDGFFVGIQFQGLPPDDVKKIRQMRAWFTSPEYRVKASTKRKLEEAGS